MSLFNLNAVIPSRVVPSNECLVVPRFAIRTGIEFVHNTRALGIVVAAYRKPLHTDVGLYSWSFASLITGAC